MPRLQHIASPMKGVDWGPLYNTFKDANLDSEELEVETKRLMLNDDVTKKAGIYPYLLDDDEKHLSIRVFSDAMKLETFEKQGGFCLLCKIIVQH